MQTERQTERQTYTQSTAKRTDTSGPQTDERQTDTQTHGQTNANRRPTISQSRPVQSTIYKVQCNMLRKCLVLMFYYLERPLNPKSLKVNTATGPSDGGEATARGLKRLTGRALRGMPYPLHPICPPLPSAAPAALSPNPSPRLQSSRRPPCASCPPATPP